VIEVLKMTKDAFRKYLAVVGLASLPLFSMNGCQPSQSKQDSRTIEKTRVSEAIILKSTKPIGGHVERVKLRSGRAAFYVDSQVKSELFRGYSGPLDTEHVLITHCSEHIELNDGYALDITGPFRSNNSDEKQRVFNYKKFSESVRKIADKEADSESAPWQAVDEIVPFVSDKLQGYLLDQGIEDNGNNIADAFIWDSITGNPA